MVVRESETAKEFTTTAVDNAITMEHGGLLYRVCSWLTPCSMNCLTEALDLSPPGNGSVLRWKGPIRHMEFLAGVRPKRAALFTA